MNVKIILSGQFYLVRQEILATLIIRQMVNLHILKATKMFMMIIGVFLL